MLLNNFYTVSGIDHTAGSIHATIQIQKDHPIFNGHFPSVPIVPGVCMMQIVKEVTESQTNSRLMMTSADNMKFLSVLDPTQHADVEVTVAYEQHNDSFQIKASILAGQLTFFKLNATLKPVG